MLAVVTSWLMAIFASFGVFAPRNSTVILTLIVCALAVSAAVLIIMSFYLPFSGILKISPVAVLEIWATRTILGGVVKSLSKGTGLMAS